MTDKNKNQTVLSWLAVAQARGFGAVVDVLLDVLEPLGPLAAQMLWMIQPVAGAFGQQQTLGDLAELLDAPDGIESLREQLHNNDIETQ